MIDLLFYWVGLTVVSAVVGFIGLVILLYIWLWFSIAIVWAYTAIKYNTVKAKYKNRPLWKLRVYLLALSKPNQMVFDFYGTTFFTDKYRMDCTGYLPKVYPVIEVGE